MSGGASTQPVTQTTTTQISPQAQELFNTAYPGLQKFAATVPQRYPGETVAGLTPEQQTAQNLALGAVPAQQQVAGTAANTYGNLATSLGMGQNIPAFAGQTQNYETNPWAGLAASDPAMQSYIEAATRPTFQQLSEQVLPNVRGGAVTAGGYGGSRQGIAEGVAGGRALQTAADTARQLVGQEYGTNVGALQNRYATNIGAEQARYATNVGAEQNRLDLQNRARQGDVSAMLQLLQLTPTVQGAQAVPAATTAAVGEQNQALNQLRMTAAQQGWNYDQLAPFLQSQEILSLLQGFPGATTIATGNMPTPNPATQLLGGGLAGASIGGAVGGPVGAGVGAAGGAVLPFLFR